MSKRKSECRNRPMVCELCGYRVYGTRSWMAVGLPTCHCGGRILPTSPADMAVAGLVGPEDFLRADGMPGGPKWTVICKENGWDDSITRKGASAKSYNRAVLEAGGLLGRETPKPQCSYPGCGKWTASGAEFCSTHNPAGIAEDACPF